jgi:hypothetical protein
VWFLSETEMECCVPLCREAHELGVWFLSETEMECCVPLCGEAHELGVSFSLRQDEMMYWPPLCRELR